MTNHRKYASEESWVPKIKRRRRFTSSETNVLEDEFRKNSSPNQDKIQRIADTISTPRKIVTTWFQNRRAKNKRKEKFKREHNMMPEGSLEYPASSQLSGGEDEEDEDEYSSETSYVNANNDRFSVEINHHEQYHYAKDQPGIPFMDTENSMEINLSDTSIVTLPSHLNFRRYPYMPSPSQVYSQFNTMNGISFPPNQMYNINIYNNSNNYYGPCEYIQEEVVDFSPPARNTVLNQQQLFNMVYCQPQQYFSPLCINNFHFPSQLSFFSPLDDPICINPADLCSQNRYQVQQKERQDRK